MRTALIDAIALTLMRRHVTMARTMRRRFARFPFAPEPQAKHEPPCPDYYPHERHDLGSAS